MSTARYTSWATSPVHPAWDVLRQVLFGPPSHTWRSVLLLIAAGAVICGILLAGSVALAAAGTALVGLLGLLRLGRRQAAAGVHLG